jgi:hypothetical protein
MAFFQSNFAIRYFSQYDTAAFGSEVASDIIFRATHRGDGLVNFTVQRRGDSARVHSSAGAALLARDQSVGMSSCSSARFSSQMNSSSIPDEQELIPIVRYVLL